MLGVRTNFFRRKQPLDGAAVAAVTSLSIRYAHWAVPRERERERTECGLYLYFARGPRNQMEPKYTIRDVNKPTVCIKNRNNLLIKPK